MFKISNFRQHNFSIFLFTLFYICSQFVRCLNWTKKNDYCVFSGGCGRGVFPNFEFQIAGIIRQTNYISRFKDHKNSKFWSPENILAFRL